MNEDIKRPQIVQWREQKVGYKLYSITTGQYLGYECQVPNKTGSQSLEKALGETKGVAVTLEVMSVKHKQNRRF